MARYTMGFWDIIAAEAETIPVELDPRAEDFYSNVATATKAAVFGAQINIIPEQYRDFFAAGFALNFADDEIGQPTLNTWRREVARTLHNHRDYINGLLELSTEGYFTARTTTTDTREGEQETDTAGSETTSTTATGQTQTGTIAASNTTGSTTDTSKTDTNTDVTGTSGTTVIDSGSSKTDATETGTVTKNTTVSDTGTTGVTESGTTTTQAGGSDTTTNTTTDGVTQGNISVETAHGRVDQYSGGVTDKHNNFSTTVTTDTTFTPRAKEITAEQGVDKNFTGVQNAGISLQDDRNVAAAQGRDSTTTITNEGSDQTQDTNTTTHSGDILHENNTKLALSGSDTTTTTDTQKRETQADGSTNYGRTDNGTTTSQGTTTVDMSSATTGTDTTATTGGSNTATTGNSETTGTTKDTTIGSVDTQGSTTNTQSVTSDTNATTSDTRDEDTERATTGTERGTTREQGQGQTLVLDWEAAMGSSSATERIFSLFEGCFMSVW